MTGPLVILALGSLCVGAYFQWTGDFLDPKGFLSQTPVLTCLGGHEAVEPHAGGHLVVAVLSTAVALAGVLLASMLYLGRRGAVPAITRIMTGLGLYGLSYHKFFFDPIYTALVVRPLQLLAGLLAWFDQYIIDGLVNAVGSLPGAIGSMFRPLQSGLVQFYAMVMVLGLLALIGALLL